ncbi:MAG: sugar ABC transporter ATP-binding protein [Candidatus Onthomonas sp.]
MELLNMNGICKSFGGVPVLKNVRLSVEKREVHALLGENGAGKSTLMNVLTGVYPREAGTIVFDGQSYDTMTIRASERIGIAFVHQELNLFNDLKVYENIFLTREYTTRLGSLDKKRMRREAAALFQELGVDIDPEELVSHLKTSQKQLLEIAKALFFQAKLLILDEPTTSLNNAEIAHLFEILNRLKENGTSFIFISHKMPEIFALADRYTVFRNGEYIAEGRIADTTPEQITELMVGHSAGRGGLYQVRELGETVLRVQGLTGEGFHDVNLELKKGQIIGLTGLQGSGSSELMQGIFGTVPVWGGTVEAFGKSVPANSIHKAMKSRIAMLANNRKENSVVPDLSLLENMYLAEHTLSAGKFHIRKAAEQKKFDRFRQLLNIKAQSSADGILSLSGGNQQKVFLARWLNTEAEILLLDNPTQGIDVGAKEEIYALILELAKAGKAVLINTLEIPEIQKVADFCTVFYDGTIVKTLGHDEIDEQTVMLYSTGSAVQKEEQEA